MHTQLQQNSAAFYALDIEMRGEKGKKLSASPVLKSFINNKFPMRNPGLKSRGF